MYLTSTMLVRINIGMDKVSSIIEYICMVVV